MYWKATLNGNSIVLDNLYRMDSPHFSIFEDSEDHLAEQFFLSSSHLNGNADPQQVFSSMKGLIELINGASAIQWGFNNYIRRGSIALDRLYCTTSKYPSDYDWNNARVSSDVYPSNPFIGQASISILRNPYNSATTGYIELCLEYEDVFNLLRQISIGFDWRNLYCIWDTVCFYSGGSKKLIKDLFLDEAEVKAFTGTANNFGVLGLEARHGVMGWKIPTNTVSHSEAIDIVNDIVVKYLKKRACLGCKSKEW